MRYIDVHSHMLDRQWLQLLKQKGAPRYSVEPLTDKVEGIYKHGAHFMTPMPGHFDYDLRAWGNGPGVDYLTIDAEETIRVLKRMKIRSHHCDRSENQQLMSTECPRLPITRRPVR